MLTAGMAVPSVTTSVSASERVAASRTQPAAPRGVQSSWYSRLMVRRLPAPRYERMAREALFAHSVAREIPPSRSQRSA